MVFHSCLTFVKLAGIFYFISGIFGFAEETNVQWFRTAQNTDDRLTKQPDFNFGEDFTFDQVININR